MAKEHSAAQQLEPASGRAARVPHLIEAGHAFMQLGGLGARRPRGAGAEQLDVIVIGAGQAGLSVGYHLARRGLRFVILEGNARIGDSWRKRWDSLRLFTPASLDGLDGMPFPAARDYFPTKDEMADYLEAYAAHFALPVRCGVHVERLSRRDGRYLVEARASAREQDDVEAGAQRFEAPHVVVAMAAYQKPQLPELASSLDPGITQLHSSQYKNLGQLRPGPVLLAGAGNSGSELAVEIGRSHEVYMAGRETGYVPFELRSWLGRNVLCRLLLRIVFHRLLTLATPLGRKARPHIVSKGGPLIRIRPGDLAAAGVQRTGRVTEVRDGRPVLEDGRVLDVANVIWCTGYHPGFSWIDLPVFGADGTPHHTRGVVNGEPGLYFVGLPFLYAMSSTMIHGVGRDAGYVAGAIAERAVRVARASA
jgi:putative flavoprotein involved in K+ transport